MKKSKFNRTLAVAAALVMSLTCLGTSAFATDVAPSSELGTETSETGTDSIRQTSYIKYLAKYADASKPDKTFEVMGKDYEKDKTGDGTEVSVTEVDGKKDVLLESGGRTGVACRGHSAFPGGICKKIASALLQSVRKLIIM